MDDFNLDYMNALTLLLPAENSVKLFLVGCGGTGSWLAPAVARVGKLLIEKFNKEVEITFFDPDYVEEKNIYRQNFCAAEVGTNKAEALADRYGQAWGIEIGAMGKKFDRGYGFASGSSVIIGCVDNTDARKNISDYVNGCCWLDCGNTKNFGQILLGTGKGLEKAFAIPGYCGTLPYPHVQHPELIQKTQFNEKPKAKGEELSCADMALQDSQGLAINQRMAAEAADYLVRMLITRDLKKFATYIDLESGTTRSKYITEKAVKGYGKG
jgi:PRTRC genetic system ThiF family protein